MNNLAVFDFDGTITNKDTFNDFIIFSYGRLKFYVAMLFISPVIILYLIGIVKNDIPKSIIWRLFFSAMPLKKFTQLCINYAEQRLPLLIKSTATERIKWHLAKNDTVIINSASIANWITPWADKHGITQVIATTIAIDNDLLTGKFATPCCYGKQKVTRLEQMFSANTYKKLYVYGDSKGDRALLNIADYAFYKKFNMPYEVIITDGLWRKSLSAIRALGKVGHQVSVVGDSIFTTGFWSSFTKKRILSPTAQENINKFHDNIVNYLQNRHSANLPVLLPMEEATLKWLSAHRDMLKNHAQFLIPPDSSLHIALDKCRTIKLADKLNLAVPITKFSDNIAEFLHALSQLTAKNQLAEYMVKPVNGSGSSGIVYLSENKQLNWHEHWQTYGNLLIQERLDTTGIGIGVSILMDNNNRCVANFIHKRLQQYPNSGGPSTNRIGIYNDNLLQDSIKLLTALNWVGVAMVEWKIDIKTQKPKLMEINPRFWGSLELAVRSGVNFPVLYADLARGEQVVSVTEYRTDTECRWMVPGDILRYMTQVPRQRESLFKFFKGLPSSAEEWDWQDLSGTFAAVLCPAFSVIKPKYWKYLRR